MLEAISAARPVNNPMIDEDNNGNGCIVRLKFPCLVKAVGPQEIELMFERGSPMQTFTDEFITRTRAMMGTIEGDRWLENTLSDLKRELILKQVR